MAEQTIEWNDVKSFVRRRRKIFIISFLITFIFSVLIAFILPPVYRGETMILIEDQKIPERFVQSTITAYAEERLNTIKRQVFSSERLKEIVREFNLYPDIREKYGIGEAVIEMREAIVLETDSASFIDPRTGRSMAATIAFMLYYEGSEPETVQKVTNVLSELFLEEDAKIKEKITNVTTGFLKAELESLKTQIREYETKIGKFKQENFRQLPEYNQVNLEAVTRLERALDNVDMQIRNLEERKINLHGQLATVDPLLPIKVDGENVARNPSEQLKYLRLKLLSLQARLSDKHPDVRKLKSEISLLEAKAGMPADYQDEIKKLQQLNVKLTALNGRYGPKHPDVVRLKREITALEKMISNRRNERRVQTISREAPDNPMYINLQTQIATINTSIANLISDKEEIEKDLDEYRERIEKAPIVEKEYNELTRDYDGIKAKYNELMKNLMTANVARQLEEGQYGQRFEIKNYAFLPQKPYKPNRIAIILLGFVLAAGLGLALAAGREFFDHSIKNEKELSTIVGMPVLTVISKVETRQEKRKRITRNLAWTLATIGFIAVGLKLMNDHFLPMDDLWEIIINNAKKM
jgi:uncharacterized protein involved in exopolysaccharide biosynthesis